MRNNPTSWMGADFLPKSHFGRELAPEYTVIQFSLAYDHISGQASKQAKFQRFYQLIKTFLTLCVGVLLTRYGFNSCGMAEAQQRLKARGGTQQQQTKG